jgi:hypothetical protein
MSEIKQIIQADGWFASYNEDETEIEKQVACWALVKDEDGETQIRGYGAKGSKFNPSEQLHDLSENQDFRGFRTIRDRELRRSSKRIINMYPCNSGWSIVWKNNSQDKTFRAPVAMWAQYEQKDKKNDDHDPAVYSVVGMIMREQGLANVSGYGDTILGYEKDGIQVEEVFLGSEGEIVDQKNFGYGE